MFPKCGDIFFRAGRSRVMDKWCFKDSDPRYAFQFGCRQKCEISSRGVPKNICVSSTFLNNRFQVFDLALDAVWLVVRTLATAPAIVTDHRELLRQQGSQSAH